MGLLAARVFRACRLPKTTVLEIWRVFPAILLDIAVGLGAAGYFQKLLFVMEPSWCGYAGEALGIAVYRVVGISGRVTRR